METTKVPMTKDQQIPAHPRKETSQLATKYMQGRVARILLVIIGVLLSVPNTKQKKGSRLVDKCSFTHDEDKQCQGKKHQQRIQRQTRQQPLLVKDLNKSGGVLLEEQNFHVNQGMDPRCETIYLEEKQ